MIAAGKDEIRKWYIEGADKGYAYMLIVYDRMGYPGEPDSPYYAADEAKARDMLRSFQQDELSEVMEIYDLAADMEAQLSQKRAWSLPDEPEKAVYRSADDGGARAHDAPLEEKDESAASSPFQDALNNFQFYFEFLPFLWNSSERNKMFATLFDTKGGKDCMGLIFRALNALVFPERQKDAMMKTLGTKLVDDFIDGNYLNLFAIDRVNLDTGHHIFEIVLFEFNDQKMSNKVEKVFLVCKKDFSRGEVITLEFNPITKSRCLCEVGANGVHSNFGPVHNNDVYGSLKSVLQ